MSRVIAAIGDPLPTVEGQGDLVTVRNVPVVSTGIEYPLASGKTTFTPEDLADAVAAFDDPAVHAARTKIGHVDPRFNGLVTPDGQALDGEPSLGTWQNMHLSADAQTIIGDIVGCPRWLANIMATAYPSRSIEGNFDVETVTGHSWRLVIDHVALLGVIGPGVTTLDDLPMMFSSDGPEAIAVIEAEKGEPMSVAAARGSGVRRINASVTVEDVRRAYYDVLDATQMWWWIRAIYLDPNELIVDTDDGDGTLLRVPFTIDGESVNFGDPIEVKVTYVDAPKTKASQALRGALANALVPSERIAAAFDSRSDSRPGDQEEEATGMTPDQIRLLRERLQLSEDQLPDDATQEQINAVLSAPPATPEPAETTPPEDETTPPEVPVGEAQPVGASAATQVPDGMVLVDKDAWAEVQSGAKAGASVAAREAKRHKETMLTAAVKAGKFPPAALERYQKAWDKDPEGTEALIGILPDDSVPVTARGVEPTLEQGAGENGDRGYPEAWLTPGENARVNASQNGGTPAIVMGGD